jgi:hypothetical protein
MDTTCGIASCIDGVGTPGALCMGNGQCQTVVPASCGAYACVADMCTTKCNDTSECSPGNYCEVTTGKCIVPPPQPPDGGAAEEKAAAGAKSGCSAGGDTGVLSPALMLAGMLGAAGAVRARRRRRAA